jgi:hypothetical protein
MNKQLLRRATIGGFAGFSPSAVLTLSAYATEMGRSSVLAGMKVEDVFTQNRRLWVSCEASQASK